MRALENADRIREAPARFPTASRADLTAAWLRLYGCAPPSKLRRELLMRPSPIASCRRRPIAVGSTGSAKAGPLDDQQQRGFRRRAGRPRTGQPSSTDRALVGVLRGGATAANLAFADDPRRRLQDAGTRDRRALGGDPATAVRRTTDPR